MCAPALFNATPYRIAFSAFTYQKVHCARPMYFFDIRLSLTPNTNNDSTTTTGNNQCCGTQRLLFVLLYIGLHVIIATLERRPEQSIAIYVTSIARSSSYHNYVYCVCRSRQWYLCTLFCWGVWMKIKSLWAMQHSVQCALGSTHNKCFPNDFTSSFRKFIHNYLDDSCI